MTSSGMEPATFRLVAATVNIIVCWDDDRSLAIFSRNWCLHLQGKRESRARNESVMGLKKQDQEWVFVRVRSGQRLRSFCACPYQYFLCLMKAAGTPATLVTRYTTRESSPRGGGFQYLHRSPASRRRRRKENLMLGGITGPPCSCGI
jgi:hypothetical protein